MEDLEGAWVDGQVQGNAFKIIEGIKKSRALKKQAQAVPTTAEPTPKNPALDKVYAALNMAKTPTAIPVDDDLGATPRDYGLVTWSGVEDIAGAVGGATQWLSTLLPDAPAEVIRQIGKTTSEFWAHESDKTKKHMSAEAQELYSRPFLPEEGQKGVNDDWSAIPLKFMASAPAMLLTMSPIAAAAKLGYGAKALVAIGAVTEGGLATSFTANEVATAVDGLSDEEIRALPKYNELREQDNSHEDIKNAIRDDAIRVAGLVAGASSAALGGAGAAVFGKVLNATGLDNFLPKMYVPKGRLGAAAMALPTEGVQEMGQEFGEQVAGNIGKSTYNTEQDLFEGGGEAAVGGGVLGAAGGATVAGVVGPNQAPAIADPVIDEETDTGPDAVRQNAQPPPAEAPPQPGFIAGQVTDEQLQDPDGQTTQEPIADIVAQLNDMMDSDTDRKAVFIPKKTINTQAGQDLLDQISARDTILTLDDTTNETGQLFTEDKALLALWKKKSKNGKNHDEAVLAQILGYDTSKSEITDPNAPVVETTLPDGATLTGEVANPADVEAVVAKQEEQAPPEAVVEVKDAAQGQADRKAKVLAEEEQAAARVANVSANMANDTTHTAVTDFTRELVQKLGNSKDKRPVVVAGHEAVVKKLAIIEAALNRRSDPNAAQNLIAAINELPSQSRVLPAKQRAELIELLESSGLLDIDTKINDIITRMKPARKKGTGGKDIPLADTPAGVKLMADVEGSVAEQSAKDFPAAPAKAEEVVEGSVAAPKKKLVLRGASKAKARKASALKEESPADIAKAQEISAKRKARLAAKKAAETVQRPQAHTTAEVPTDQPSQATVAEVPTDQPDFAPAAPPKQARKSGSLNIAEVEEANEAADADNTAEIKKITGVRTKSVTEATDATALDEGFTTGTDSNNRTKQKNTDWERAAKLEHGEKKFTAIEKQIREEAETLVKGSDFQKEQDALTKQKAEAKKKGDTKLVSELSNRIEEVSHKKALHKSAFIAAEMRAQLPLSEKEATVGTEAGPANTDDYESQDGVETARLGEPTNQAMKGKQADIGKAAIAHVGDPEATIKKLRKLLKKAFNTKAIDFADVHQMRQLMQGDNASMDMLGVEHVGLQELLTGLQELLPEGHPQRQMIDLFITLGHDVPVIMYNPSQDTNSDRAEGWRKTAANSTGLVGNRFAVIDGRRIGSVVDPNAQYMGLNTDKIVELIGIALEPDANFRLQEYVVGSLISLITHESAHVATIRAMRDPRNHFEVEQLESLMHTIHDTLIWQGKKGILTDTGVLDTSGGIGYGFSDVYEFVAEALSNPEFQQLLMTTRVPVQHTKHFSPTRRKIATAWQALVSSVGKLLKVKPVNKDAFTEVLALTQDLVETAKQADTRAFSLKQEVREMLQEDDGGDLLSGGVIPSYEKMSETLGTHRANRMSRAVTAVTKLPSRGALGWHQLDQIFRRFGSRMGQSMKDYASHVAHKQAIVTQERKLADKISRAWHKAVAANPKWADKLSSVMKESTIAGLDASAPFTDVRNKHAWKNPAKRKEHAKLRAQYKALQKAAPELAAIYPKVGKYFQNQRARTQRYAVDNLINSYPSLKGNLNLAAKVLKAVDKLDVESAITGAARGQMNPAQISALVKHIGKIKALTEVKGVYFPLRRYGNYVVSAKRTPAPMLFSTKEMAKAYIQEVEANLIPGLQPNSTAKLDKVNKRLVHFEEYAVEMYESEHAANVGYERLRKEFDGGEIESPRIRQDSDMQAGGQQYAKLVQQIKSNVGNSRYNAGIDAALIQLMAENSVRKSELARQGVQGASGDMNRAFAERAMAGSWTMADLRVGRDQAETMEIMQKTADNHADPKTRLTLGAVVKELKTREEGDIQDRQQRPVIDFITKTGYYWFLASPSYVIQNATQIFLVTGPYLGAKFGHAKTSAAMLKNIKQVMPDLLSEVKDTGFGVVDMPENIVDNTIKKWGGDADPAVHMETNAAKTKGDMLRWLLDRGRIDATFIQELYQSVQGTDPGKMTKVMGYATTWAKAWPQMVEQMNRIVTAGAAYDLAIGKKKSQLEAMYAAEEAVLETQLDYSNTNRARHMKLGGYGRVIFMFKTYSQGITALMIKSVAAAAGRGDISRAEGANTLISLMISHSLAGGILGGVMTQPVRMIYAAIKELFGDDDEFKSVDDYIEDWTLSMSKAGLEAAGISTEYAAKVAEAASRGLPRVWGSDMHSSLGLHNIIGLSAQPTDSTRDKALHYMVQMLGPVAATGATAAGGWDYFNKGEYSKMIESITPKGVRSLIRAKRFNDEGVTDYTGTPILESDQLNGWHIFNEALGVPSAPKSRMYEQRGSVKLYEQKQLKAATMLRERWRNTTPAERHVAGGIMEEIRSFNRANPGAAITMDTLYSSKMAQREKAAAARQNKFGESATYKDLPWAK